MVDLSEEYPNDPAMRQVSLGIDAQHFLTQDRLGRYIKSRASQYREDALEALAEVDPTDTDKIRHLQLQAQLPDMLLTWLAEAIAEGRAAEENIRLEEQNQN